MLRWCKLCQDCTACLQHRLLTAPSVRLQVCMADFQKRMSSFQGPAAEAAGLQVAWCGTDSVLLHGQVS